MACGGRAGRGRAYALWVQCARGWVDIKLTHRSRISRKAARQDVTRAWPRDLPLPYNPWWRANHREDRVTQLGSPATESGPSDHGRQAVRGSRLARRRRALLWVAG